MCLQFAGPLNTCVLLVQMLCERLDVCSFNHCEGIINVYVYFIVGLHS